MRTEAFELGRVPFRVRFAVTGHIALEATDQLRQTIREQADRVRDALAPPPRRGERAITPVRFSVISQLAEGGDRLVVEELSGEAERRGEEARLEVILPLGRHDYALAQGLSSDSQDQIDRWIDQATWSYEPADVVPPLEDEPEDRRRTIEARAYAVAGRQLTARCDVLIALWDGEASGGLGGTADTLVEAALRRTPCIWISTEGEPRVTDNFAQGSARSLPAEAFYAEVRRRAAITEKPAKTASSHDQPVLERLRDAFRHVDRFNRAAVPADFAAAVNVRVAPGASQLEWLAGVFSRADSIASLYQRIFMRLVLTLAVLISLAAVFLALSIVLHDPLWSALFEVAALVGAGAMFLYVRRRNYHSLWLSCRLLAERLRSAFSLAPTNADLRDVVAPEVAYVERSAEWEQRVFEEVWDRRPQPTRGPRNRPIAQLDVIKPAILAWIDGQIAFHRKRALEHERADIWLTRCVAAFFILAVAAALVGAALATAQVTGSGHDVALALAIVLPGLSASFGIVLSVRQDRALSLRYRKMDGELEVARHDIAEADETTLGAASYSAARIIGQESGNWLGAMWFLDVEHL